MSINEKPSDDISVTGRGTLPSSGNPMWTGSLATGLKPIYYPAELDLSGAPDSLTPAKSRAVEGAIMDALYGILRKQAIEEKARRMLRGAYVHSHKGIPNRRGHRTGPAPLKKMQADLNRTLSTGIVRD